MQKYFIE